MIKKNKKRLKLLIIFTIVAALGIGTTLALLRDVTETKKNTFASNKKISLLLREPSWDGYEFSDLTTTNGKSANPNITGDDLNTLGVIRASQYVPGENIPKNPQVKNSGNADTGVPIYAAIKVQFLDEADTQITYEEFLNRYLAETGITFDTEHWKEIDTQSADKLFMYKTVLKPGEDTSANPLFAQVPLNLNIEPDSVTGLFPEFHIKVTAYAIQSDYVENPQEEMLKFVNGITE